MALITIQDFTRSKFAPGSAPHVNTVRRLIREGKLSGCKFGARYYVEELAVEAGFNPTVERIMADVRRAP